MLSDLLPYLGIALAGLGTTIWIAILSILVAAAVSLILGLVHVSRSRPARIVSRTLVEIMRGASAIVYLFWVFYTLPLIPGAPQLTAHTVAVLVLGFGGGALGSEIVRAGMQSLPPNQLDSCKALSLPGRVTQFVVLLPQALSQIVPPFGSLAVDMVKWTTIVSFIGIQDLFGVAQAARFQFPTDTVQIFLVLIVVYLVLCSLTSFLFRGLEWFLPMSRVQRRVAAEARGSAETAKAVIPA